MDLTLLEAFLKHIHVYDSRLCIAVIAILFNPLFWNVVSAALDCIRAFFFLATKKECILVLMCVLLILCNQNLILPLPKRAIVFQ